MHEFKRDGQKFGALTLTGKSHTTSEIVWWNYKCKCGKTRTVEERRLVKGLIATFLKCKVKNKTANQ